MAKDTNTDSSVVMALSELVQMEEARIQTDRYREAQHLAEVRAEREREAAAADQAERQRAERALREARVAEAEARIRVEADRERDQRIASMRTELARVEAERQTLRVDLESRRTAREQSRPSGWALAFGLSSLVAASLAGLLVMQQGSQVIVRATPPSAPVVLAPAPHGEDLMAREAPPAAPVALEVAAPEVHAPIARGGRHPRHDHDQTTVTTSQQGSEIIGLGEDDGNDDVLGPELVEHAHRSLQH